MYHDGFVGEKSYFFGSFNVCFDGNCVNGSSKTQAADPITWAVCGAYEATIGKLFGAIGDKVEGVITGALDNVAGVTTGAAPVNDATTHAGQRSQVSNEKKTECERFVADVALATLKNGF